jgi:hypothetical protein
MFVDSEDSKKYKVYKTFDTTKSNFFSKNFENI